MHCEPSRWYTFCDKHKAKIETEGKWTKGGPAETCDYNMRGNKRCRDDAPWEFAPGGEEWK